MSDPASQKVHNYLDMSWWERARWVRAQARGTLYYEWFIRHWSCFLTATLSYTRVTPNQLTLTMFVWGAAGAVCFAQATPLGFVLGGLCFIGLHLSDCLDGELARLKRQTSSIGDYIDQLAHYATNAALVLLAGYGLARWHSADWILFLAIAVEIAHTLDETARDMLVVAGLKRQQTAGGGGDAGDPRKSIKSKTRLGGDSLITRFVKWTGSNMGYMYLAAPVALIDLLGWTDGLGSNLSASLLLFLYFGALTSAKAAVRLFRISRLLVEQHASASNGDD